MSSESNTLKILFTGDLYPAGGASDLLCLTNNETINHIKFITKDCDYSVVNLEAPLCFDGYKYNPISKTGPNIFGKSTVIQGMKSMGFNIASLANNHIMDMGAAALDDTLNICKDNGIMTYGAGQNLNNARKALFLEHNGVKIGLLAFAENEFCNTNGDEHGANPLKLTDNFRDIRDAKNKCDKVIVSFHGGIEMYNLPAPYLKDICRFFVDAGANAVIVHHTHCYSGYEVYQKAPIFYSLGNFLFDSVHIVPKSEVNLWSEGYSVELSLTKHSIGYRLIPHIQFPLYKGIRSMSEQEKSVFDLNIDELNAVISSDELLSRKFVEFTRKAKYTYYFEKYPKQLLKFVSRKILPSTIKGFYARLLLNLIRCEAHRYITIQTLKNIELDENRLHNGN